MLVDNIFFSPIVISKFTYEHDIIKQNHLDTLLNLPNLPFRKIEDDYTKEHVPDEMLAHISVNKNILDIENLSEIKDVILQAAKIYTSDVLCIRNEFLMTNSWLTKNKTNSRHPFHHHSNILFSVVTYFYDDLSYDSFDKIIWELPGLKNNFECFQFEYDISQFNSINSKSWEVRPKTNEIFIFPGHIYHSTDFNHSEKTRYCLGANFFVTGTIGCEQDTTQLNMKINNK